MKMNNFTHMNDYDYPFFVEYIDEDGIEYDDTWSVRTLNEELNRNDVIIKRISLSYKVQVALGLITED